MKEKLLELLENSYSPYSKFKVAAIAVMKDGKEFVGVNVENASYGVCNCAERSAIFSAISNGYKRYDFEKLYVMCDCDEIGTPCFICRQALVDYCNLDLEIISYNILGENNKYILNDLTPNSFGEENLK